MSTNAAINLSDLSATQLAELHKLMQAKRKSESPDRKAWTAIVDVMLQAKDGEEFAHTTLAIVEELRAKGVVKASPTKENTAAEIKKVQTRKQLLEKKRDKDGKALYSVGYKASANGFAVTLDRVLAWLPTADKDELATLAKALKPLTK